MLLNLNQRIVPIVSIVLKKNAFNVVLKKPIVLQNNRLDLSLLLNLNQRIVPIVSIVFKNNRF